MKHSIGFCYMNVEYWSYIKDVALWHSAVAIVGRFRLISVTQGLSE